MWTLLRVDIALSCDGLPLNGRWTNRSCALRSMAEMGLSASTREVAGALLGRWRAQCGTRQSLYRNHRGRVFAAGMLGRRYTRRVTRFPEPCGRSASRPHQSSPWRTNARFSSDSGDILLHGQCAHVLSLVPLVTDRDDREKPRRRQLLAMHAVRRRVECGAHARRQVEPTTMAVTRTVAVRELLELIAALDRRLPQVQRAGEEAIARDAAALRTRALKRIEELERES